MKPHFCVPLVLVACSDSLARDVDASIDALPVDCPRVPAPADRVRHVVISHPFDSNNQPSNRYEVLELGFGVDRWLDRMNPPRFFEMSGRTTKGTIPFTPDGKLGFISYDDGGVGVFSIDAAGVIAPVHYAWEGSGFASALEVSPDGTTLYILDRRDRVNGGGIYAATINCDGTLTDRGLIAGGSPIGLGFRGGSTAKTVIAANDFLDHAEPNDELHIADLSASPPTRIGGSDAFDGTNPPLVQFALSPSGDLAFVGDGNRIGIARVTDSAITFVATVPNISNLGGIVASPFADIAVISETLPATPPDYNTLFKIHEVNGVWTKSKITWGANRSRPRDIVSIDRGALRGTFVVSTETQVQVLAFENDYTLPYSSNAHFPPDDPANFPGALGVTP